MELRELVEILNGGVDKIIDGLFSYYFRDIELDQEIINELNKEKESIYYPIKLAMTGAKALVNAVPLDMLDLDTETIRKTQIVTILYVIQNNQEILGDHLLDLYNDYYEILFNEESESYSKVMHKCISPTHKIEKPSDCNWCLMAPLLRQLIEEDEDNNPEHAIYQTIEQAIQDEEVTIKELINEARLADFIDLVIQAYRARNPESEVADFIISAAGHSGHLFQVECPKTYQCNFCYRPQEAGTCYIAHGRYICDDCMPQ